MNLTHTHRGSQFGIFVVNKATQKISLTVYITLLLLVSLAPRAHAINNRTQTPLIIWTEGAAAGGQYIGQDKNYIEFGTLITPRLENDRWIYFSDLRGYILDDDCYAASAGIGLRGMLGNSGSIIGGNFYYDYFNSRFGSFNRVGIGLEILRDCFDIRMNSYIPITDSNKSSKKRYEYEGGYVAECREKETTFRGIDAEIGKRFCSCYGVNFYGAIGPYYYSGCDLPNVAGCSSRIEAFCSDIVKIEGLFSYDNEYHFQAQAKLSISIPFDTLMCCFRKCACYSNCYGRPVVRNSLPFFHRCCDWDWNW